MSSGQRGQQVSKHAKRQETARTQHRPAQGVRVALKHEGRAVGQDLGTPLLPHFLESNAVDLMAARKSPYALKTAAPLSLKFATGMGSASGVESTDIEASQVTAWSPRVEEVLGPLCVQQPRSSREQTP